MRNVQTPISLQSAVTTILARRAFQKHAARTPEEPRRRGSLLYGAAYGTAGGLVGKALRSHYRRTKFNPGVASAYRDWGNSPRNTAPRFARTADSSLERLQGRSVKDLLQRTSMKRGIQHYTAFANRLWRSQPFFIRRAPLVAALAGASTGFLRSRRAAQAET